MYVSSGCTASMKAMRRLKGVSYEREESNASSVCVFCVVLLCLVLV